MWSDILITIIFAGIINMAYNIANNFFIDRGQFNALNINIKRCDLKIKSTNKNSILYYQLKKEKSILQMDLFKLQFKPTIVMIIPIILTLSLLSNIVDKWILTYIIASIIWSLIFKRLKKS